MTADTIPTRRQTGRWQDIAVRVVAVAAVIACVLVVTGKVHLSPSTAEPSPAAEGYTAVGTVDGVNFWLVVRGPNEVGFRTTGRMGGICNDDTPYAAALGPYPVCAQSMQAAGSVFAFVVPEDVRQMSLPLTSGEVGPSGALPLETLLHGRQLLVVVAPLGKNEPLVSMEGPPVVS